MDANLTASVRTLQTIAPRSRNRYPGADRILTGPHSHRAFSTLVRVLCLSALLLITACGGGSDDNASTANRSAQSSPTLPGEAQGPQAQRTAASTAIDSASVQAPKRRARPYDRKGITAITLSPDGATLGVASSDGKVSLRDAASMGEIRSVTPPSGPPAAALIFSGDGRVLFSAGRDSVANAWNVESGEHRFAMNGHEHPLRSIAGSADGTVVATAAEETRVMLWDGATGRLKQILSGHTDFVNALSMSADGRLLATGGADARVLVWETGTGKLLRTLLGHADELTSLAFNNDGKLLASAGLDGKVILWDVSRGLQLQALNGQSAPVLSLAFNGDGSLLAGGAQDGRVVVWSAVTFSTAREIAGPGSGVNTVVFDLKNRYRVYAGDQSGQVVSWIVPPSIGR